MLEFALGRSGVRHRWMLGAIGVAASLVLVGCAGGAGGNSATQSPTPVSPTATDTPEPTAEPTPTAAPTQQPTEQPTQQPAAITDGQLRALLLTPDDLLRAGTFPKGPFDEEFQTQPGAQSYTTYDTVSPAECADFVQGPFGGTSFDAAGPIVGSGLVFFTEGEVASVPGNPVTIIESVQVFSSEDAAAQAFSTITANAPNCRRYSYDDGGGLLERDWLDVFVTTGNDNPLYTDTVSMFDEQSLRAIGLLGDRIWGLSLRSSRAMDFVEIERFEDLIDLLKSRLGADSD